MRKVYVVFAAVVIVLGAVVAVMLLRPDLTTDLLRSKTKVTGEDQVNKAVSIFVRNPYKDDYGVVRIPGYVDNLGNKEITRVQLKITLYEKQDRREIVTYEVENVPVGSRKTFDANAGVLEGGRTAEVVVETLEVYE